MELVKLQNDQDSIEIEKIIEGRYDEFKAAWNSHFGN